jgi:hypothetical protein
MSILNKLFGSNKAKTEAIKEASRKFDEGKHKFLKIFINGLSDSDIEERKGCAKLIVSEVIPALDLDKGIASKEASLATINKLVSELRPPQNEEEYYDLENAAFHFMMLQLRKANK